MIRLTRSTTAAQRQPRAASMIQQMLDVKQVDVKQFSCRLQKKTRHHDSEEQTWTAPAKKNAWGLRCAAGP
jgi:hypothetical protein